MGCCTLLDYLFQHMRPQAIELGIQFVFHLMKRGFGVLGVSILHGCQHLLAQLLRGCFIRVLCHLFLLILILLPAAFS